MVIRRLKKDSFSEMVVRSSLYWMSPLTHWKLNEENEEWLITFSSEDESVLFEFERLINDYVLREKISGKTGVHLDAISRAVLQSVERKLSQ
ncbi:His-Xaa-Ser system protein HxsD [Photobacterium sp. CCB-ST2H9]|uniref:His-Xaa-Ser system protein HxsD n=1 Tax=unclassified Photobacterium TaxID=2628852 RepID=UPI002005E826|nr:His-Xaa-Ser system protein HxsD [Photobacterium sp. CCB-ST2H9]UTM59572.1 His-Xaa-Ser system protein HxsD [Photobacterium sp. CCB-ST2H9]